MKRSSSKRLAFAASSKPGPATARVDGYAAAVVAGDIPAGPLVRLACERHQRDRALETAAGGHPLGFRFDETAAATAIDFFERVLRLPDVLDAEGEAAPFLLQPWQAFIIGSLFGWRKADGYRRFRDAYVEVGKGNGKTPMAAGIGLYLLVMDGEQAAEVYAAATTRDQAIICWRDALRMVETSDELRQIVTRAAWSLSYQPTYSWFRPLSSEHRGLDGKRPHGGLIDEVHEHPDAQVVNKIRAGAKRRRQPLFFEITNSGYDRTSICWAHHEHSRHILEGTLQDERWFAYVCGLDEGEDPLADHGCWIKANPNLGISIREDYLTDQVNRANAIPAETNIVLRLNFCCWTQASQRYIGAAKWMACRGVVTDAELEGVPCYAGLDLGSTDDFSAFVLLWTLPGETYAIRAWFWLPEDTLTAHPDRPYDEWRRGGWLTVTSGNTTDYSVVRETISAEARRWDLRELAYDKRFAGETALILQGEGLVCLDQMQGYHLNQGIVALSEVVERKALITDGNPILAWMADNAVTVTGRDGDLRLAKERSREKIDGIVATVMALQRAKLNPSPDLAQIEAEGMRVW